MQTGLLIRPSGAVHTGSMFGDGIYFADKAQKSIGYSSLSGSHWTKVIMRIELF
jgi:poly [ADP-ribose] polymerase